MFFVLTDVLFFFCKKKHVVAKKYGGPMGGPHGPLLGKVGGPMGREIPYGAPWGPQPGLLFWTVGRSSYRSYRGYRNTYIILYIYIYIINICIYIYFFFFFFFFFLWGPLLYPEGAHGPPPWGPHIFSYNISCLAATFYFFAKNNHNTKKYNCRKNIFCFMLKYL